jgi:hypothetical protein
MWERDIDRFLVELEKATKKFNKERGEKSRSTG